MADSNALNKIFAQNITKDKFVENYGNFKSGLSADDIGSVFTSDLDVGSDGKLFRTPEKDESGNAVFQSLDTNGDKKVSAEEAAKLNTNSEAKELFTTLDTNNDGKLDTNEISALTKYYDDKDDNKKISFNDLTGLYSRTIERLGEKNTPDKAGDIYNKAKQDTSTPPMDNITSQEDVIINLKNTRQVLYQSKVQQLQSQLDDVVTKSSDMTKQQKKEYESNKQKLEKERAKRKDKEAELEQTKEDMEMAQAEIDYIKKHKDADSKENQDKIEKYTKQYNNLKSKCDSLSSDISGIDSKIDNLNTKQETLTSQVKFNKNDAEMNKNRLMAALKQEETSYRNDMRSYDSQLTAIKSAEEMARANDTADYSSEMYQDGDTSKYSYDSKALKAKWGKKHPELSDGFFNKVCEISKRVGCDPNGLMAVMQSESGLKANARNKSSGAIGLIQFMPKTASILGTSTDALSKMSPEKQLDYVEKYLNSNKKMAGIKSGEKVDNATLYTLVFLPAYAKRDVLATSGSAYYRSNKGLDMDHDGRITKADMNIRMNKMIAKA